jgi:hypothetical protein
MRVRLSRAILGTVLTVVAVAGGCPTGDGTTPLNSATFINPPLFDIQVRFRDGGSEQTMLDGVIGCDNPTGTDSSADTDDWDDTFTSTGDQVPPGVTIDITCTFTVDP